MFVPPRQVIDTVEIFRKGKRKVSLRALAAFFLNKTIQDGTHDSIQDAQIALELYILYKKLCEEGTFDAKLAELYEEGQRHGWKQFNGIKLT